MNIDFHFELFIEVVYHNMSVCYVPKAEVNPGILNVRLWENRPSDLTTQWLLSAHCCHFHELIFVP
jgi:hypothetical protein